MESSCLSRLVLLCTLALTFMLTRCTWNWDRFEPHSDAGPDRQGPAMTYTYVVRSLSIDDNDAPESPHTGFNLDNHFSGPTDPQGCNHQDFFSTIDPDQNAPGLPCTAARVMNGEFCGGVDNQLPTVAKSFRQSMPPFDLNARINQEISSGRLALIVQVADVDSLQNDDSVTVRIALGYPTFQDCNQLFTGGTFRVAQSSLNMGGTSIRDAQFSVRGRIDNGRLQVSTDANSIFPLPLPIIPNFDLTFNLHAPAFRINLSAMPNAQNGNLGGWIDGNDLVRAVIRVAPEYEMAVRQAVAGLVDVQYNGICVDGTGMFARYGGISMGLGLTVVPAVLSDEAPLAERLPNTCGDQAPGDGGM